MDGLSQEAIEGALAVQRMLEAVNRDVTIKSAASRVYTYLFLRALEIRDAKIHVNVGELCGAMGIKKTDTVVAALEQLQDKHDLISMVERSKRFGTMLVYVYAPRPRTPEQRPDPQQLLDFGHLEVPEQLLPNFGRKSEPENRTPNFGQKSEPGNSAPGNDLGKAPPKFGQKSERPFNEDKESNTSNSSTSQRTSNVNDVDKEGGAGGETSIAELMPAALIATAEAQAALIDAPSWTEQRLKWKRDINDAVGPGLEDWCAGRAADLVGVHLVDPEKLLHIMSDLCNARIRRAHAIRKGENPKPMHPPSIFNAECRKLAHFSNLPWTNEEIERVKRGLPWNKDRNPGGKA